MINTRWFAFNLVVAFCLQDGFNAPAFDDVPDSVGDSAPRGALTLPHCADDGRIRIPVTINQTTYAFLIDTGASQTVFDARLIDLLGAYIETVSVQTMTGPMQLKRYGPPKDMSVCGAKFKGERGFLVADLGEVADPKTYGVLGMDYLKNTVLQLDFARSEAHLLEQVPDAVGHEVPISLNKRSMVPRCTIAVGDLKDIRVIIDTGAAGGLYVGPGTFMQLFENGDVDNITFDAQTGLAGSRPRMIGRATRFRLDSIARKGMTICTSFDNLTALGTDCFAGLVVTFDFPHSRMYVRPGQYYVEPDSWDRGGMIVERRAGDLFVWRVVRGGPAWQCGIRRGDVIVSIDGEPAADVSLAELEFQLTQDARQFKIEIARDKAMVCAKLTTGDYRDTAFGEEVDRFFNDMPWQNVGWPMIIFETLPN